MSYSDNDSVMASGGSMQNPFPEVHDNEETEEIKKDQYAKVQALIPTARIQLEEIDREIAQVDSLTNFVNSIKLPTDLSESSLRAKLEGRFVYMNFLINRRGPYLEALRQANDTEPITEFKQPPHESPVTLPRLKPAESRLHGWAAIKQGFKDLFTRQRM